MAGTAGFFDFSGRLTGGVGPVLLAAADFTLGTQNPVPLDGLIESESMFAFVANEGIEGRDESRRCCGADDPLGAGCSRPHEREEERERGGMQKPGRGLRELEGRKLSRHVVASHEDSRGRGVEGDPLGIGLIQEGEQVDRGERVARGPIHQRESVVLVDHEEVPRAWIQRQTLG